MSLSMRAATTDHGNRGSWGVGLIHGPHSQVFGAHFSEMWRMDLRSYQWKRVEYVGEMPVKRALHVAVVVQNSMYVYGGIELSDTWRFEFGTRKWHLLVPAPTSKDPSHPGACAAAPRRCEPTQATRVHSTTGSVAEPFLRHSLLICHGCRPTTCTSRRRRPKLLLHFRGWQGAQLATAMVCCSTL